MELDVLGVKRWKLIAPDIDRLEKHFSGLEIPQPEYVYDVDDAIEQLFDEIRNLCPLEEDRNTKTIWLKIPRGKMEDFWRFEYQLQERFPEENEFKSYWLKLYPDEYKWYELTAVEKLDEDGDPYYCAIKINKKTIVSADYDLKPREMDHDGNDWYALVLCDLLKEAARESMALIKSGKYNELLENELPYQNRFGVIRRSDVWDAYPEIKKDTQSSIPEDVFQRFKEIIESGENDPDKIPRLSEMTTTDFLKACSLGYKACGYDVFDKDGNELSPYEQYLRYAEKNNVFFPGFRNKNDGTPECEADMIDPHKWDEWYFKKNSPEGYPWQVCGKGSPTHIDLLVNHDNQKHKWEFIPDNDECNTTAKNGEDYGYYFVIEGSTLNRMADTIRFFVAIHDDGYPVILKNGKELLQRLNGEGYIGIVPWATYPRYCEGYFPEKYGNVIDFIHLLPSEYENLKDHIEWLPIRKASLKA